MKPTVYKFWEILPKLVEGRFALSNDGRYPGLVYKYHNKSLWYYDHHIKQWAESTNSIRDMNEMGYTLAEDPEAPKWTQCNFEGLWPAITKAIKEGNRKFQVKCVLQSGGPCTSTYQFDELAYYHTIKHFASWKGTFMYLES